MAGTHSHPGPPVGAVCIKLTSLLARLGLFWQFKSGWLAKSVAVRNSAHSHRVPGAGAKWKSCHERAERRQNGCII